MDTVLALLKKSGWKEEGEIKGEGTMVDRPLYGFRQSRILVGPLWVTHYRKTGDDSTDGLNSVKTDDLKAVEGVIKLHMNLK